MNVLVVGGGGREHAIAWKARRSRLADEVFALPGNPGMAEDGIACVPGDPEDVRHVVSEARRLGAGLVLVGPEAPLGLGLADTLEAAGLPVFGPGRLAAEIETSKTWSKRFMKRHGIPTADGDVFDDLDAALRFIRRHGGPLVVKADGLAAGKGVVVADRLEEAEDAARSMLVEGRFGEAGRRVVVEERLVGRELSFMAVCDGRSALPLLPARDAKRLLDGDRGPNTGGMGAFAPVPDVTPDLERAVRRDVIEAALAGLAAEGRAFRGVLYAGLMLTPRGPKVLEFNARFGDPETQALLPLLDTDLVEVALAAARGDLAGARLGWSQRTAVCVVLAAAGYPDTPERGAVIEGWRTARGEADAHPDSLLFAAGVGPGWTVSGGRVLDAVGLGGTLGEARQRAYDLAARVSFPGAQYRTDICAICKIPGH